jgi:hypothetical protein
MSKLADELGELRLGLAGGAPDDDFVARVMAACQDGASQAAAPQRRLWPYGVGLAAAACVALGLTSLPARYGTRSDEVVTARGVHAGVRATVQAFVAHAAPGAAAPPLEGASLRQGDGILVRYSNPSSEAVYLMVFALDARESVHWLQPAYLDERTNPSSLPLPPRAMEQVLPEVAEPEDAALGPLRVYALLSRSPLDVKTVERRLGSERDPVELFPEAEVAKWRCTWMR